MAGINDDKMGIPTGMNNDLVQEALRASNAAVGQQRAAAIGGVQRAEATMLDQLGRQQLQSERDIADRRMRALRSGQSSSNIAAMELANVQAGQIGAQQVTNELLDRRLEVETQFAGKESLNKKFMLDALMQNTKDAAAIDAQKYSSSQYAQLQALFPNASAEDIEIMSRMALHGRDALSEDEQARMNALNGAGQSTLQQEMVGDWGLSQGQYESMMSADGFLDWGAFKSTETVYTWFSGKAQARKQAYNRYVDEYNRLHGTDHSYKTD